MKYKKFIIHQYKGIKKDLTVDLDNGEKIMAIIGLNECGKSSILKAILGFDHSNDDRYKSENHLKDLVNYYQTGMSPELKISAIIQLEDNEQFKNDIYNYCNENDCFEEFGVKLPTETDEDGEETIVKPEINSEEFLKQYRSFLSKEIKITRLFNEEEPDDSYYTLAHEKFTEISDDMQNDFSKIVIKYLPICNYLHTRSSIEEEIIINDTNKNKYWNVIFNNLFIKALKNKTLYDIANNPNRNIRESALEEVKNYLNREYISAWNELGRDENFTESIYFNLNIDEDNGQKKLIISLKEKIKDYISPKSFKIVNRSEGFQWYYTFIMQLLFNPVVKSDYNKSVLFLLDEPGMYLNPVAQISLLKRFTEIINGNEDMQIIYTTHSHHMLNTEYLNPYQVHIAEKDKNDLIKLYNLKNYPNKNTKHSALTPLFDSLQVPFDERVIGAKKVILVEGIHDFYALSLFGNFDKSYYIYPCAGATTIEKNIAFFIMLKNDYAYLVDNDYEGIEKALKSIETHYEKERGVYLPFDGYINIETGEINEEGKFEMDNIFDDVLDTWFNELNLVRANYQRLIEYMYYNKNKTKVKELLKNETILARFEIIKNKILEKFN